MGVLAKWPDHCPPGTRKSTHPPGAAGTHIVLPGYFCPPGFGLLDMNTSDGRFLFFLPWQGFTIVGTTDRKGSPDSNPGPPEEEIQWILDEVEKYLHADVRVRRSDVLSAWQVTHMPSLRESSSSIVHLSAFTHELCPSRAPADRAGGRWRQTRTRSQAPQSAETTSSRLTRGPASLSSPAANGRHIGRWPRTSSTGSLPRRGSGGGAAAPTAGHSLEAPASPGTHRSS